MLSIIGDLTRDILIPEEGRANLILGKESVSEEQLTQSRAVEHPGGVIYLRWLMEAIRGSGGSEQAFDFETFCLAKKNDAEVEINPVESRTYWELKRCPKTLGRRSKKVYRVTDQTNHERGIERDCRKKGDTFQPCQFDGDLSFKLPGNDSLANPDLLIVSDYNQEIRRLKGWEDWLKTNIEEQESDGAKIRRVILIGHQLPSTLVRRPSNRANDISSEHLWNKFYPERAAHFAAEECWPGKFGRREKIDRNQQALFASTLVITSIDRLRHEGARISKFKSWDRLVDDFVGDLERFEALRELRKFGHLIVRIGVTGAIYCRRNVSGYDEYGEEEDVSYEVKFIYDPTASHAMFRDLAKQGNVFATRSSYPALIAAALLGNRGRLSESDCVELGIERAIRFGQQIYEMGFGDTLSEVRSFQFRCRELFGKAYKVATDAPIDEKGNLPKFIHKVVLPGPSNAFEWGIVRDTMRCGLKKDQFQTAIDKKFGCGSGKKSSKERKGAAADCLDEKLQKLGRLEELRRLRCARHIVYVGADEALNQRPCHPPSDLELEEALRELEGRAEDFQAGMRTIVHELDYWLDREKRIKELEEERNIDLELRRNRYRVWLDETILRLGLLEKEEYKEELSSICLTPCDFETSWPKQGLMGKLRQLEDKIRANRNVAGAEDQITELMELLKKQQEDEERCLKDLYPFNFPVVRFGDLEIVGQHDIDNYHNIRTLISIHLEQERAETPLSIAVFGPPGGGKSWGIKQVAAEIAEDQIESFTANVSQFLDRSDFNRAFVRIADIRSRGKIPLVFFDEFDCAKGGPLGWLKFFLEPMQDGTFQHPDGPISLGNSILVFAGGTARSYAEFCRLPEIRARYSRSPDVYHRETDALGSVKAAKLPDFVSRLKGYIDIPGVNQRRSFEKIDADARFSAAEKQIPYQRRGLILRSFLVRRGFIKIDPDHADRGLECGVAQIDYDVVNAFLKASYYRHGARSIGAILDMCMPFNGRVVRASLPRAEQLEMHTRGAEFLLRVRRPEFLWPARTQNIAIPPNRRKSPMFAGRVFKPSSDSAWTPFEKEAHCRFEEWEAPELSGPGFEEEIWNQLTQTLGLLWTKVEKCLDTPGDKKMVEELRKDLSENHLFFILLHGSKEVPMLLVKNGQSNDGKGVAWQLFGLNPHVTDDPMDWDDQDRKQQVRSLFEAVNGKPLVEAIHKYETEKRAERTQSPETERQVNLIEGSIADLFGRRLPELFGRSQNREAEKGGSRFFRMWKRRGPSPNEAPSKVQSRGEKNLD